MSDHLFSSFDTDPLAGFFDWGGDHHVPNLSHDVVGDPTGDAHAWRQQETPATCAIVSQQMILDEFGVDLTEAQLMYEGMSNGWFGPGGTSPEHIGSLLELHGVGTHTVPGSNVTDLASELAQGHKVIVGVDSGELWGTDSFFSDWIEGGRGADHAIVVTGIDVSNPDHPMVYINDPGSPDGAGKAYPLDEFLDAWGDSGNLYVATDDAPPDLQDNSIFGPNFNPDTGMYLDAAWWSDLLSMVGEVAVNFVAFTLSAHETTGEGVAALDQAGRDNLMLLI